MKYFFITFQSTLDQLFGMITILQNLYKIVSRDSHCDRDFMPAINRTQPSSYYAFSEFKPEIHFSCRVNYMG